jgi:hypothetical protein
MAGTLCPGQVDSPVNSDFERTRIMTAPFVWHVLTASPTDPDRVRALSANLVGWTIGPAANTGP